VRVKQSCSCARRSRAWIHDARDRVGGLCRGDRGLPAQEVVRGVGVRVRRRGARHRAHDHRAVVKVSRELAPVTITGPRRRSARRSRRGRRARRSCARPAPLERYLLLQETLRRSVPLWWFFTRCGLDPRARAKAREVRRRAQREPAGRRLGQIAHAADVHAGPETPRSFGLSNPTASTVSCAPEATAITAARSASVPVRSSVDHRGRLAELQRLGDVHGPIGAYSEPAKTTSICVAARRCPRRVGLQHRVHTRSSALFVQCSAKALQPAPMIAALPGCSCCLPAWPHFQK